MACPRAWAAQWLIRVMSCPRLLAMPLTSLSPLPLRGVGDTLSWELSKPGEHSVPRATSGGNDDEFGDRLKEHGGRPMSRFADEIQPVVLPIIKVGPWLPALLTCGLLVPRAAAGVGQCNWADPC